METRVAVISIIVEAGTSTDALNQRLHEASPYIIGRMGIPYRKRGINIISVAIDASVAAASILAKVTRDTFMEKMDEQYPEYGFAVHKGYGTRRHYDAIREYGMCSIHRRTFLKKFYGEK